MTEEEGEVRVRVAVAVVLAPPIGEATWKRAGWRESLGRSLYYALGAGEELDSEGDFSGRRTP